MQHIFRLQVLVNVMRIRCLSHGLLRAHSGYYSEIRLFILGEIIYEDVPSTSIPSIHVMQRL